MQPVALTRPTSTCFRCNLRDGATCTTRCRVSVSLQGRLENPSQTCFHMKQAAKSRRVFRTDLIPSVFVAQPTNRSPLGFEAQTKKPTTSFEAKSGETVAAGFEAKPLKTVATSFEVKPMKTVRVVLRPNHSQTVDLVFKA
jgi:hypothetical protein